MLSLSGRELRNVVQRGKARCCQQPTKPQAISGSTICDLPLPAPAPDHRFPLQSMIEICQSGQVDPDLYDLYDLYDVPHAAGRQPYQLHCLRLLSWARSARYTCCTTLIIGSRVYISPFLNNMLDFWFGNNRVCR